MRRKKHAVQSELFGVSRTHELQYSIKNLEAEISIALKSNDYQKAKELTAAQEKLINELVSLGEKLPPEKQE